MSKGQSQPRTHPARRGFGRCKSKIIEIIDVDKGKADVVIIDSPKSSYYASACSTTKYNSNPAIFIQIDDEEGDSDASPSNAGQSFTNNRACPVFGNNPLEKELDNSECLIYHRKGASPSNLRSDKHIVFGSPTGHYGLHSSESSSCGSDCSECDCYEQDSSDCEIIEDSSGLIREQWERAAIRRKMSQKVRVGCEDQASASGSSDDPVLFPAEPIENMVDLDDCMNESSSEHFKAPSGKCSPICSNSQKRHTFNASNSKEHSGESYTGNNNEEFHGDLDAFTENNCGGPSTEKEKTFESSVQREQVFEADSDHNKTYVPSEQVQGNIHSTVDESNFMRENENVPSGNSSSACEGPSFEKEKKIENSVQREQVFKADNTMHNKTYTPNEQVHVNIHSTVDELNFMRKYENVPSENSSYTSTCRVDDFAEGEPCPGKPSEASGAKHSISVSTGFENQKEDFLHKQPLHNTRPDLEGMVEAKEKPSVEQTSPSSELLHEMNQSNYYCSNNVEATRGESRINARNETSSKNIDGPDFSLSQGNITGDLENPNVPQFQSDITGDREKHKESDDYKRANEEEWASRKREIQIQAEEAQRLRRLRKRRNAESLRLLDMEKRQRQRVEEIRESQRKDEEIINLKERLRAEVRKELDKMELQYGDMASLLRGLGIHVGGGPSPLSHEVSAAYKQALLRFHPDRTSSSDIRKQVEAEETFKMISRLKEKLMPVS